MKRYIYMVKVIPTMLLSICLGGCGLVSGQDESPYKHVFREMEAHLNEDASSPFCDFSIDYSYLDEEGDSIAALINRSIQKEFLGKDYASLAPEMAVDSFMNAYIRDYRKETGELYRTDSVRNGTDTPMPQWYSQTYSLVTFVEEGQGGIVNVSANWFVDMGGAHPDQWSRWMNFDFETGKLLTKEDVFKPEAKADIESILLHYLLLQQAGLYPDEKLETLEDIREKGFLQMTNMYIPDNFLLQKDGISFLFNRYDIAPYSAGETMLEVPYEEIGHCMKQ